MSITVTVRHIFALLSLVWHRYHFGTIFRKPWGSKHSFHGNISVTHIDKRIGAAVFLWWRMKPQKLRGLQLVNTIKHCQYMQGKRGIHISRGIYLIFHYESDNKRLLSPSFPFSFFFSAQSTLWLCLTPGLLQYLSAVANGQQFPIRFFTLQMDVLICCSCSHQAAEKQSGTV